jgi:peptidoglycan/xylan/chitin deacetylase (PgdA/CDA1 family)
MSVTDPITATGFDDGRFAYVPMPNRPAFNWSNGAAVAFYPIVLVEYYEEVPPEDAVVAGDVFGGLGGGGPLRHPQVTRVGNRDYGNRVGFFRIMEAFEALGIKPVIAIDAMAAEHYPAIVKWIASHDVDVIAHGVAITRAITSKMTSEEEAAYIADAKARIDAALSITTKGWLGPTGSESGSTLQLIADAGFTYCLDWPNDEQPYYFETDPALLGLPPIFELSDNHAINARALFNEDYARALVDAATQLVIDGATSGRLMSFTMNTWTSGQPARMAYVKSALREIVAMPGIWVTTPSEVAAEMAAVAGKG